VPSSPAARQHDPFVLTGQGFISRISINHQASAPVLQVFCREPAAPAGLAVEAHDGRAALFPADVTPQIACPGFSTFLRVQDLQGRFINMQHIAGQ
jgi:hypothetical protein